MCEAKAHYEKKSGKNFPSRRVFSAKASFTPFLVVSIFDSMTSCSFLSFSSTFAVMAVVDLQRIKLDIEKINYINFNDRLLYT